MAALTYSNEDINRFWLQIMSDNALLLINSLSPVEKEDIREGRSFVEQFDAYALQANKNPTANQTAQINREAFQLTQNLRKWILQIAKKYLTSIYYLDLKPAVIDYFVDESEKYLDLLHTFMQNKPLRVDLIQEEIFWLRIFTQQAYYIYDNVGYYEKEYRENALKIAKKLNDFWAFSVDLKGISRIGREDFPIALNHHTAVVTQLMEYYEFLTSIIFTQQTVRIPGSLSLLYLDRSRRMVCLFLKLAAQYASTEVPDCDQFSKRISTL